MQPVSLNVLLFVITIFLIFINAFFVAAEFALVKVRLEQLEESASHYQLLSKYAIKVFSDQDTYLAVCQIGITMASLAIGWIGEPSVAFFIDFLFGYIGLSDIVKINPHLIAFIISFVFISYFHIVVGEQAPKFFSISESKKVTLYCAIPLYFLGYLFKPLIYVLNRSSDKLLSVLGQSGDVDPHSSSYSNHEIKKLMRHHSPVGWTKEEMSDFSNALDIGETHIEEIMRPLSELQFMCEDFSLEDCSNVMTSHHFSRFPVYDKEETEVVGVVHVKDLIQCILKGSGKRFKIRDVLRPIVKINIETHISEVLRELKDGKPHIAIVYKNKIACGFVTFNDILEEFFGYVDDEIKVGCVDEVNLEEGVWLVKGNMSLGSLGRLLNVKINSKAKTVAGLILERLENFPKEGEKIIFDKFSLLVKKTSNTKVLLVRVDVGDFT